MNQYTPLLEYILVFIMAAVPWMEILVVIPLAVAYGLHPPGVVLTAFIGNALPIWVIIYTYHRWMAWRKKKNRCRLPKGHNLTPENYSSGTDNRGRRLAKKIWDRYGLPGLALVGPIATGIHLAVLLALAAKSPPHATVFWMTTSLALWSTGLGVLSFYGLELVFW